MSTELTDALNRILSWIEQPKPKYVASEDTADFTVEVADGCGASIYVNGANGIC